ncbi:MAG: phosphate butyryltransferase [Calditrichia bacterium]
MIQSFNEIISTVQGKKRRRIAVAYAQDMDVLLALKNATENNLADGILIGDEAKINQIAEEINLDFSHFKVINETDEVQATQKAVDVVRNGEAEVIMKGLCSTATFLKAILKSETGLKSGSMLSHLAIFEVEHYHKLIFMSDAALNIAPTLDEKVGIIQNAVNACHKLGNENPKVAMITAVEKVNPAKMPATSDAAIISKMAERGQIKHCIIDGPLAVDNAFSKKSCEIKGIRSEVGGDADIAIVPDIEAGNVFYKVMSYLAGARTAGLILGAKVPVVLTSRADSDDTKYLSIATACLLG